MQQRLKVLGGLKLTVIGINPSNENCPKILYRIYADNRQFETAKDLQNAISKAWNEIDEDVIKNLVNSMPERIFQVINRNGSCTDY
uniref:Mutator family transposase n=1 Tax=Heterorhabditis bacteriophora TaxID=37862 RepID=A0A1I7WXJ3_HETBA